MKKISTYCILVAATILSALSLTSCYDDTWAPAPPYGWSDFYDSRLNGFWELYQANDVQVSARNTNYLFFNGNGGGYYYYYTTGRLMRERMAYYCQDAVSGNSRYQINIQYENGRPSTMSYWFTGDTLWMQWTSNGRLTTYLYRPVSSVPY